MWDGPWAVGAVLQTVSAVALALKTAWFWPQELLTEEIDTLNAWVFTPIPSMNSNLALNQELTRCYERWLVVQRYVPHTRYTYARGVRKFSAFLGSKSTLKTTHLDIQDYLGLCAAEGSSPKRIRGELSAFVISTRKFLTS